MTKLVDRLSVTMADLLPKHPATRIYSATRPTEHIISTRLYQALEAYAAAEGVTFTAAFRQLQDELNGGRG